MKKCKKKDGLIYDFEIAEINKENTQSDKKVEYRIYSNNDFICAMSENEFKENFEVIEEGKSYSSILKEFVNSDYDGERSFWDRAGAKRELTEVLLLLGRYKLTHYTEEFCKAILDKYKVPYEDNTKVEKEETPSKEDYKKFLEIRDMMVEMKKKNILKQIKDKEEEIESNQELLTKGLIVPLARPVVKLCNEEIKRLRAEIEVLKCTLEGLEKNNEKM